MSRIYTERTIGLKLGATLLLRYCKYIYSASSVFANNPIWRIFMQPVTYADIKLFPIIFSNLTTALTVVSWSVTASGQAISNCILVSCPQLDTVNRREGGYYSLLIKKLLLCSHNYTIKYTFTHCTFDLSVDIITIIHISAP